MKNPTDITLKLNQFKGHRMNTQLVNEQFIELCKSERFKGQIKNKIDKIISFYQKNKILIEKQCRDEYILISLLSLYLDNKKSKIEIKSATDNKTIMSGSAREILIKILEAMGAGYDIKGMSNLHINVMEHSSNILH